MGNIQSSKGANKMKARLVLEKKVKRTPESVQCEIDEDDAMEDRARAIEEIDEWIGECHERGDWFRRYDE